MMTTCLDFNGILENYNFRSFRGLQRTLVLATKTDLFVLVRSISF